MVSSPLDHSYYPRHLHTNTGQIKASRGRCLFFETPYNCVRRTRHLLVPNNGQNALKDIERKYQFHFNEFLTTEDIQQMSKAKENFGSNYEDYLNHNNNNIESINLCKEMSKIDVDDYLSNRGEVEKEFIETYHYLTSTTKEEQSNDNNNENHQYSINHEVSLINTKGKLLGIDDIINMKVSNSSKDSYQVNSSIQTNQRYTNGNQRKEYEASEISNGQTKEAGNENSKVNLARKQLDLLQQMRRETMKKMISVSKSKYIQQIKDDENRKSGGNEFSKSQGGFNGKGRLTANNQLDLSNLPEEELIEILSISGNSGDK